jgi:hypothetical protein
MLCSFKMTNCRVIQFTILSLLGAMTNIQRLIGVTDQPLPIEPHASSG